MVGLLRRLTVRTSLGISSALISFSPAAQYIAGFFHRAGLKPLGDPKIEKITRLVYESARHVADATSRPRFVAGPSAPSVSSR